MNPLQTAHLASIGALLARTVADHGDQPAVIYHRLGLRLSYRELEARARRVARGLAALDIQPGEHLAVWATNIPEWIELQLGCALRGVVLVTVNTGYRPFELAYVLKQSEAVALFFKPSLRTPGDALAAIREIRPEALPPGGAGGGPIRSTPLPALRRLVVMGEVTDSGLMSWDQFLAKGDQETGEGLVACRPDQIAMIQYTSGTTGFPKGAMLSHANLLDNIRSVADLLAMSHQDRLCIPLPFFHCFGSVMGTLLCLAHGSAMVPVVQFRPQEVLETVAACGCTLLHGVPTMFIAELEVLKKKPIAISTLRGGLMGGAPCPEAVVRDLTHALGMPELCIAYGLTETSPAITLTRRDLPFAQRATTVGTPLPGVEVKIVAPGSASPLPPGEQGELCCRGPNVMAGYFRMPEATAQAIDPEGWFHSGDLATQDEQGLVRITGRAKDMIIRGGENIYPREIEEFLFTHPAIKDVQVVGVPSPLYGEEIAAFMQLKDGMTLAPDDIREFCKSRIARPKIPKYLAIVDTYPTTTNGKVQKFKLREQAITRFGLVTAPAAGAGAEIRRSAVLCLLAGQDSFGRTVDFMNHGVAPWGVGLKVLFKAAAAVNEMMELLQGHALLHGPLEVRFAFDNGRLELHFAYRGQVPEFPTQPPPAEEIIRDEVAVKRLAGYLIQRYAQILTTTEQQGQCDIRLALNADDREGTPKNA